MEKIEKLNSVELKLVLKWLKLYSNLTKKLWNRWKAIFDKEISWNNTYKIEYTSSIGKEWAWEKATVAFEKVFWESPKKEKVSFILNDDILWWVKIFKNDDMVDLSLSKAMDQIV